MLPALVLTAGLGTRLDPITRLLAKAAVPLAGSTLIERSLGRLVGQGVTDAVLNLHHLPESVTAIVGDGAHLGLRVRYSWERRILGSAGGPRHALPLLDADQFLIINGDTLCDIDLVGIVAQHRASGADVTMAVVPNPSPEHYNGIRVAGDGRITSFVPKGDAEGSWHFIGVQVVNARVFAGLEDGIPEETVSGIYRRALASGTYHLFAYRSNLPFVDVGTTLDYWRAAFEMASGKDNVVESGSRVALSARMTQCVVWKDAVVGDDAHLSRCIVTSVEIPAGYRAEDSVLVPVSVMKGTDAATVTGDIAAFPMTR